MPINHCTVFLFLKGVHACGLPLCKLTMYNGAILVAFIYRWFKLTINEALQNFPCKQVLIVKPRSKIQLLNQGKSLERELTKSLEHALNHSTMTNQWSIVFQLGTISSLLFSNQRSIVFQSVVYCFPIKQQSIFYCFPIKQTKDQ